MATPPQSSWPDRPRAEPTQPIGNNADPRVRKIHGRWAPVIAAAGGLAVLLTTLLLVLYWTHQLFFGTSKENLPASETGGGGYHTNHILNDNPYAAVRQVYQRIADGSPYFACGAFTDEAAQQFAQHFNAPDCPNAIDLLHEQVDKSAGSKNAYAEPDFHGKMGQRPDSGTIMVSSCELGVNAGPRLGMFTVSRVELGQWIITAHQRESC
jgi:hypothetical protein